MQWMVMVLLVVLGGQAGASPNRPTPDMVSLTATDDQGRRVKWWGDQPATQAQADAITQWTVGVWIPRALRYAETNHNGASTCYSIFNKLTKGLLSAYYEIGGSKLVYSVDGNLYGYPQDTLRCVRNLATGTACHQKPGMTPDLLTVLGLTVVNNKCVGVPLAPEPTGWNATIFSRNPLNYAVRMPVLTREQLGLIDATEIAHGGAGGTPQAEFALEASAETPLQQYFFQNNAFVGGCHPAWTPAECDEWHTFQHLFYTNITAGWRTGNWKLERRAAGSHQQVHDATILGPRKEVTYRIYGCDKAGKFIGDVSAKLCPKWTARQMLVAMGS